MTRSLIKKASGQSRSSEYRKAVLLKLLAFALALAVFFPLTALLSRPKPMKDLSEGALPGTFATRDKELQRELAALSAQRALPKQREDGSSPASRRLCAQIANALASSEFQKLKIACDKFNAGFEAQQATLAPEARGFQQMLAFAKAWPEPFELQRTQASLLQAFAQGEASQVPISLKELAPDNAPSPLPDLQKALSASFAFQLAAGRQEDAVKTLSFMLKMANCVLNSTAPDIALLLETLRLASSSLGTDAWSDPAALRELQLELQRQRGRPLPQRNILAAERERMLLGFEAVRQKGLRSLDGTAPGVNMLADAIRELKPSAAFIVAENLWNGVSYSPDGDETAALKLFKRMNGPGFMPYFKAAPLLSREAGDAGMTAKLKASLLNSYRKQSEALALLEAMDAAIRLRLGMELDKSKASPLTGSHYGILKSSGRAKIVFGNAETDAVKVELR